MPESTSDIERYRKLLERDPDSRVFAPLAEACRKANRLQEALAIARSGVSRHPTYASGRVALARAQLALGLYDEAAGQLTEALVHAPENALAHRLLGEARAQLGDREAAFDAFARALALNPGDAEAREAMGRLEASPPAGVSQTPASVEASPEEAPGGDARVSDEPPLQDGTPSADPVADSLPAPEPIDLGGPAGAWGPAVPSPEAGGAAEAELALDLEPLGAPATIEEAGPRGGAGADLPDLSDHAPSGLSQAEGEGPAGDPAGEGAGADFGWAEEPGDSHLRDPYFDEEAGAAGQGAHGTVEGAESWVPEPDDGGRSEGTGAAQDIWDRESFDLPGADPREADGVSATALGAAPEETAEEEGAVTLLDEFVPEEAEAREAASEDGTRDDRFLGRGAGQGDAGFETGPYDEGPGSGDALAVEPEPLAAAGSDRSVVEAAMEPLSRRLEELDIAASSLAPEAREAVPPETGPPPPDPPREAPRRDPDPPADALPLDRRVEELADQYLRLGYPDRARALYRSLLAGNPMNLHAQRKLREMGPEGRDGVAAPASGDQAVRRKVEQNIDVLNRWLANIRKGAAR